MTQAAVEDGSEREADAEVADTPDDLIGVRYRGRPRASRTSAGPLLLDADLPPFFTTGGRPLR